MYRSYYIYCFYKRYIKQRNTNLDFITEQNTLIIFEVYSLQIEANVFA